MHTCLHSAEENADIIIIQEPWIGTNEEEKTFYTISHPSFEPIMSHTEHCPRTITFYSRTNQFLQISLQPNICNDEDIQVLKISTPTIDPIYLFNIYNETPRYNRKLPYTVERKLQYVNFPERTILAGDFNSHHLWWNSKAKRNLRHEKLITLLEQNDFDLLNEEDTPTRHYNNGSSVLDLTFSTADVTPLISNWTVDEDNPTSSDHEVIHFDITSDSEEHILPLTNEKWNWKKAEWEGFSEHLKERTEISRDVWTTLHRECNLRNLDSSASYLTKIIQEAADIFVPRTRQCMRSKPWWNETIDTAREIMKSRLREWKADRTTPKRNQFNATRNYYHQTVRAEKNKVWYTFLSEARDREIFQALRYTKPRRKEPTPDITFQGTTATTFKEKASVFRQALFPAPPVSQVREDADPISHTLPWPKVTTDEIQNPIRSSSSTKVPGPDSIGFECIKMAYNTILEYINTLFQGLF